MQGISSMKPTFKAVAAGVAVFALGTAFAPLANAGCDPRLPSVCRRRDAVSL
jgi:hypothetical protein